MQCIQVATLLHQDTLVTPARIPHRKDTLHHLRNIHPPATLLLNIHHLPTVVDIRHLPTVVDIRHRKVDIRQRRIHIHNNQLQEGMHSNLQAILRLVTQVMVIPHLCKAAVVVCLEYSEAAAMVRAHLQVALGRCSPEVLRWRPQPWERTKHNTVAALTGCTAALASSRKASSSMASTVNTRGCLGAGDRSHPNSNRSISPNYGYHCIVSPPY
ncbi:hypothetical protein GUJ93_ZPchr0013g34244 [Zizania palustris]|uniref:Uncharacterized protein n=1 Tax=Zizania palustris TaxID=103762 RepID=A0A8J5X6X3_ZIZPA|nr:hypothetical protein GUJ93_ZPchr0013g34244 [Zizania palustris]